MPFGATSDTAIGVSKDAAAVRNAVAANPFRLSVSGAAGASGGDCVGANATGGVMQPAESFDCAKEAAAMGSVDRLLHILFLTRPELVCAPCFCHVAGSVERTPGTPSDTSRGTLAGTAERMGYNGPTRITHSIVQDRFEDLLFFCFGVFLASLGSVAASSIKRAERERVLKVDICSLPRGYQSQELKRLKRLWEARARETVTCYRHPLSTSLQSLLSPNARR